jgi:integration host factor subunit beta
MEKMSTTRKKDLVDRIAESTQVKNALVKAIVQNFLDEIISELTKGNRLEFRDFGVFEVKKRAARKAQNPKTLEPIDVPARRRVKFKMGRIMKKKLNTRITKK